MAAAGELTAAVEVAAAVGVAAAGESTAAVGIAARWVWTPEGEIDEPGGAAWLAGEGERAGEDCLAALTFCCWTLLRSKLFSLIFLGWAAGSGAATGAGRGGRNGAEAGVEVVRDAGCGEDGVADDEEESEGTDVVVEGVEAGGGGGAVDRDEEGEEDRSKE